MQDFGSDLSLEAYMQLPVEQYYELDPAMIRPLGGKRFALQVPRVNVSISDSLCIKGQLLHWLRMPTGLTNCNKLYLQRNIILLPLRPA